MILTCPECATRYFLPDVQIGRDGRTVKCAQCGAKWREFPPPDAPVEGGAEAEAPPAPAADQAPEVSVSAARRAEILREKKAMAERRASQAATVNAAVWSGLTAAVVISLGLAVVFREAVVRLWPGTATAYAAIGMPVNSTGLMIDKVQAAPGMVQGHKALMVTGVLRNVAAAAVAAPAFRVDVLDRTGRALDHKIIQISAPPLKVGESRPFSLGVADPPPGYTDVSVTLALPQTGPPVAAAPIPARTPAAALPPSSTPAMSSAAAIAPKPEAP